MYYPSGINHYAVEPAAENTPHIGVNLMAQTARNFELFWQKKCFLNHFLQSVDEIFEGVFLAEIIVWR